MATHPAELDEFLTSGLKRQIDADFAIHDGDPAPRIDQWSHTAPITIFGAHVPLVTGWPEAEETFHWLAGRFSHCCHFDVELVAAEVSGDLAYTVGFEHSECSLEGGPVIPRVLRVTQIYRRENGEWRIVHRHGDAPPPDGRRQLPHIATNPTQPGDKS
jgi:ketosteroid isomerase-like protein